MARVSLPPHWGDNDQEMVVVWLHECQKPVESIRGGDKLSQLIVFYVDRLRSIDQIVIGKALLNADRSVHR